MAEIFDKTTRLASSLDPQLDGGSQPLLVTEDFKSVGAASGHPC